jgi:tetratricopeptide (TPR) repeat protein
MKKYLIITLFLLIISFRNAPCSVPDSTSTCPDSRKTDYFFLEALKLKSGGKHTAAFQALLHCLETDSTSAAAHYEMANYCLFLKQANLVVEHLEKAVRYSNGNFDYKLALANVSRELGMNGEAIGAYEELIAKHPEKPELNYYLSDLYAKTGNTEKAIRALDVLEENIGMNESLSTRKYRLYAAMEKQEEANLEMRKLAAQYPMEARYSLMMGDLYLEQDKPEEAYEYYQKARRTDPENPYYTVSMAGYYEYIRDTEAAKQQIDSALKNTRLDVETKLGILTRYISALQQAKKDTKGVDALFRTLLEQHPQETDLNMLYGNYLMAEKMTDEAKFQYRIVTEIAPDNETAWRQLLGIALKEEKNDDCLAVCRSAQVYFPESPEFYFYEGVALSLQKAYRDALAIFEKGVAFVAKDDRELLSDFYGQMGDMYYQLKDREKAFESYETALKHNEKNAGVLNNYAYFLAINRDDLNKAERLSVETIRIQPDNSTFIDTYAWIFFLRKNYTLAKFYIESAISKGGDKSAEIIDHYGDILYFTGDHSKALEQWIKALEMGKDTETVRKKIKEGIYYEDTAVE